MNFLNNHRDGTTMNSGQQSVTYPTESDDPIIDTTGNTGSMLMTSQNPLKQPMVKGDNISSGALLRATDYHCGGGKIENTITVNSDRNHHLGL